MPSDLVGTQVFDFATQKFSTQIGPIHANFVLLDEINRSNAKTQSAMLEAMAEGATTIGGQCIALPKPFMVIATQNPIEEEGTFNLPEAQMDRFMMKAVMTYPTAQEEQRMLTMLTHRGSDTFDSRTLTGDVVSISDVEFLRAAARRVHVSDAIMKYAVDITATSRGAGTKPVQGLSTLVRLGASPRASIALTRIGQANALMQGRDYVIPEDVKAFTHEVLRHRILLTFEALARRRHQRSGRGLDRSGGSRSMIDAIRSEDPIRSKIEALGTTLSLPTVRKALGVLEGAHASDKRFGADDVMDIRIYEPGDEAKRIDWKTSARVGRPMVVQRERPSTSRAWLLLDVGQEMTGTCVSGEQVHQVAANALCMFAALSLRRGDEVSIVFGDSGSITRVPFNGGLTQFEQTLDNALQRDWNKPRNIDALLEYARRIRDRDALVVIATDEHALKERHVESIRRIARTHPMVLIDVATINPFDNSHARDVFDAGSDRRIPAFLRTGKTAQEVRTHREYLSASIRHELNRCGSTVIRADSSERMFREFVRMVSASLSRSTRNQLKAPSSLTLGGKA